MMMLWSRFCCRWVRWRGTRAAWLRLPHAVIVSTAACVVCAGPMRALPVPAAPPPAVRAMAPAWPPMGAFLPGYGGGFAGGPGGGWGAVYLPAGSTPWGTPGGPGSPGAPPSRPVPEPGALALLAAGVAALVLTRSRRA